MSPYAASTVCESSVSLFEIPAVALLVYILPTFPFFSSLSCLPLFPPPSLLSPPSPKSFSFSEIKRLLTSSRLMEPFFPHNGVLGMTFFFWSATQSTEE
uniref:Uncharacterized protein n=1 Tax=Lynx canadensis TaxID=61383 RepID=A0A667GM04_LYNCA